MALVPVADLRHTDGQEWVCQRQVKTRTARKIANPGHPVNSQVPGKNRGADVRGLARLAGAGNSSR